MSKKLFVIEYWKDLPKDWPMWIKNFVESKKLQVFLALTSKLNQFLKIPVSEKIKNSSCNTNFTKRSYYDLIKREHTISKALHTKNVIVSGSFISTCPNFLLIPPRTLGLAPSSTILKFFFHKHCSPLQSVHREETS